jgi:predicted MFS family arabinose efflux permease
MAARSVRLWHLAAFVTFAANGVAFASWVTRTPDIRSALRIDNAAVGLIILGLSLGSMLGLSLSGQLVARHGARPIVAIGASLIGLGVAIVGVGSGISAVPVVALGMVFTGIGFGLAEVAVNVEGAGIEAAVGRSVLPGLHGAYSLGALTGSGLGALAQLVGVSVVVHLVVAGLLSLAAPLLVVRFFPRGTGQERSLSSGSVSTTESRARVRDRLSVWREPRTLLIGAMVLGISFAEGAANDWLPLGLVDGYGLDPALASLGFVLFIASMAAGRMFGGRFVDRFGRVPVLWVLGATASLGILLVIIGPHLAVVSASLVSLAVGCVLWGLGISLAFPLGVSAASDDPRHSSARVSAVATMGYLAFLVGPPILGFISTAVGLLPSFLLCFALVAATLAITHYSRELASKNPG